MPAALTAATPPTIHQSGLLVSFAYAPGGGRSSIRLACTELVSRSLIRTSLSWGLLPTALICTRWGPLSRVPTQLPVPTTCPSTLITAEASETMRSVPSCTSGCS
jgi:hypothetical protein